LTSLTFIILIRNLGYKLVQFTPGDRLVLARNDQYWGTKPYWDRITFRMISNDSARVASLLGGDVDMIEYVPPTEAPSLEKNKNLSVFKRPTARVIYLCLNQTLEKSPYLTTKDGKPLDKNPLQDARVRKAISMGIDREAICSKVMEGLAAPASQLLPEGMFGYNPGIKVEKYDPASARRLLAEAGYPNGFGLTIHGPNDRYVNDAKICQAVAQMLARIGLTLKVETMPVNVMMGKVKPPTGEYAVFMIGWGNPSGESTDAMIQIFHSYNKDAGYGAINHSNYVNPEVDRLAEQAGTTIENAAREKILQRAMELAMNDLAYVPLHAQYIILATRKGLTAVPRMDEQTIVLDVKPEKL
jgi:peptide/nickel transport system substrate-binding protein